MIVLKIADTPIRTDAEGRYCLNDLHRASGGAGHHQPGKFFANKSTQELVAEMQGASPNSETPVATVNDGVNNGTYVAKELVYAYAMWISPAFHLRVIRAYDAMQAQPTRAELAVPQTLPEALRLAADLAEGKAKAEAALAVASPKAAALDRIAVATDGALCLRAAAKLLQVPEKQFVQFLMSEKWVFRHHHGRTLMGYGDREREGLLELKRTQVERDDGSAKTVEQVLVTPRGLAKLGELIERKAPHLRKFVGVHGSAAPQHALPGMH